MLFLNTLMAHGKFIIFDTAQPRDQYVRYRTSKEHLRRKDSDPLQFLTVGLMPWTLLKDDWLVSEDESPIYLATLGYYDSIFFFFLETERLLLAESPDRDLEIALANDLWMLKGALDDRRNKGLVPLHNDEVNRLYKQPIQRKVHLLALSSSCRLSSSRNVASGF